MAQQVRVLAPMFDDLILIIKSYTVQGESQLSKIVLCP